MKKLNILGIISSDNAVGFYRIYQPLLAMQRLGLANVTLTPTFAWGKGKSDQVTFPDLKWFSEEINKLKPDIIYAERHDHINYIALLGAMRDNSRSKLVVDTDDDVQAVRPYNPGYESYSPDSDNVASNIKLMSVADAITVSTTHLGERHARYQKPVIHQPNSIDLKNRTFKRIPRNDGKIRIGWLGSGCHYENLQLIQQAVKDIVANYPQVEFYYVDMYPFWRNQPEGAPKRMRKQMKPIKYVTFDKYAQNINKLNLDIGLAPLYDNMFNRSKSNLRVLEYWGDGVAVIASPVRPYTETITNGVDGLFAKERKDWYDLMEKLILDEDLRIKLQKNGRKSLEKNHNIDDTARKLHADLLKIL